MILWTLAIVSATLSMAMGKRRMPVNFTAWYSVMPKYLANCIMLLQKHIGKGDKKDDLLAVSKNIKFIPSR